MRVSFYNIGCKVNFAEISQIQKQFESMGAEIVEFGSPSDTVIINTCSVTNLADLDCRKIIRRALRANPKAFVAVTGCYAQLKPDEIAKIEGVDAIFGTKFKFDIPLLIDKFEKLDKPLIFVAPTHEHLPYHSAISVDNESRTRIVFKLQDGCDYTCTYCTIPLARGKSRSMPFDQVRRKIIELQDSEYEEVVLSGINLGEYQSTTGETFLDVVKLIVSLQPRQRFRISSIEPNKLSDDILNIIANSDVFCPHFHIPLQSGSEEILRKMRRRYNTRLYANLIEKIKLLMADASIGVDVITGFPGENPEHFEETYNFLEGLPVSYLHVFTYSERSGTPAANFQEIVPLPKRKERTNILRKLSELKRRQFYESQLNKTLTVIPEEYNNSTGLWKGWSQNYVRIEFPAPADLDKKRVDVLTQKVLGGTVLGIASNYE
ncbi:MAG: tRNA (N(6)-L-threonylcarbamoyladenosine(37)-C(2))-methylthiotransferase MtaB [Candidatus Kapaibacteriales bacterium]